MWRQKERISLAGDFFKTVHHDSDSVVGVNGGFTFCLQSQALRCSALYMTVWFHDTTHKRFR